MRPNMTNPTENQDIRDQFLLAKSGSEPAPDGVSSENFSIDTIHSEFPEILENADFFQKGMAPRPIDSGRWCSRSMPRAIFWIQTRHWSPLCAMWMGYAKKKTGFGGSWTISEWASSSRKPTKPPVWRPWIV